MGDGTLTYTVDEALMSLRFGKFQALVLAYSGMGWISEAMEMMLLSFVGPAVQSEWKLSSHQESLITSVVFTGMLLGAYSWGIVSDNYGRRNGFLFTALVTTGAGFLSSFAPNYLSLIILRFMVGIGLGGGPVLCSWFLEFIPAPNRGFWMVIFQAFWTVGTLLEASLAWAVMPKFGWRWLLALSSFPSFVLLVFYAVTPESPRYLCMKGRMADAMHVLEKVAMLNHAKLPSGMLISDHKIELDEKPNPSGFELDGQSMMTICLLVCLSERLFFRIPTGVSSDRSINNSPSIWCSNLYLRELHSRIHLCSRDIPNLSQDYRHRNCKFSGKNWWHYVSACGCWYATCLPSDGSNYFI